jgi:hypothetical protein
MLTKDKIGTLISRLGHSRVMTDYKNIKLHQDTYDRLKQHGNMDESFDDLINRILDDWEQNNE